MALQTATDARTASDAAAILPNPAVGSPAINRMNSNITTESTRTDTDERIYTVTVRYNADLHNNVQAAEIIQADSTRVFVDDVKTVLIGAGYRVSITRILKNDGDFVKITVSW